MKFDSSAADVARCFGLSKRTIYRYKQTKRIPYLKVSSGCLRFDLEAVRNALAQQSQKEAASK